MGTLLNEESCSIQTKEIPLPQKVQEIQITYGREI